MNLVWVFVDSVRRYYANDDRTKLKYMDIFAENSINIKNMVTSAPSTVMSLSAMMTGRHSFYLGSNYNDFRHNKNKFPTLASVLQKHGWECSALLMHPEIREKFTAVPLLKRNRWPSNYSHGDWWNNSKILELCEKVIEEENPYENKFWFVDYNCRKDPGINDIVRNTFQIFHDRGYNRENSIMILCSDHGYPDPSTIFNSTYLAKHNLTHDMFMTDDNIMIPFSISFPGIKGRQDIYEQFSTISIFPTILNYLGYELPFNNGYEYEKSFLNLSPEKNDLNNLARCDARFLGQKGRITAIRSNKYKLVISQSGKNHELYKIDDMKEEICEIDQNLVTYNKLTKYYNRTSDIPEKIESNLLAREIYKIKRSNIKVHIITTFISDNFTSKFKSQIESITTNSCYITHVNQNNLLVNIILNYVKNNQYNNATVIYINNGLTSKLLKLIINLLKIIGFKVYIKTPLSYSDIQSPTKTIARYLKTIYYSRNLYYAEPLLIFKLFAQRLKNYIKARKQDVIYK